VDDEPDILVTLKKTLEVKNYRTECVLDGRTAIDMYKAQPFDLVITDIRMPGMDGINVLKQIKQLDEHAAVIMLTGYASIEDAIKTLKNNGAYDYLAKPLDSIDALYVSVEKAIEKRRLQLENAALLEKLQEKQIELERQNEDLRNTQAKLRKSESKYRKLIETSPDAILYNAMDATVRMANRQAAVVFGFADVTEMKGHSIYNLISAEYAEKSRQYFQGMFQEGYLRDVEIELLRRDGSSFAGELSAALIPDHLGQPGHFMVIVRDVTERKQFEQTLRESEYRCALATRAAKIGIWEWDPQSREFYLYPNIKELLGYRDEEIPNDLRIWSSFVHPQDKEAIIAAFTSHIEGREPEICFEHRMKHKDGSHRWVLTRGTALRDSLGHVLKIIGTDMDITTLKRTELALRKAHDELEQRVIQRTDELARTNRQLSDEIEGHKLTETELKERESELRQKSQNLEEVNTALTVLLEKREADKKALEETVLLNTKRLIIPYLDKIKRKGLSPEQKSYIDVIESHLNEIISPFFRSLSSNYLDLTPTEIQVADLVRQGKTTKEMAEILNSSVRSVEFHRNSLRKKFGLTHKKINLRTYLLGLK
jgi:PAS domain S-box-containing protein